MNIGFRPVDPHDGSRLQASLDQQMAHVREFVGSQNPLFLACTLGVMLATERAAQEAIDGEIAKGKAHDGYLRCDSTAGISIKAVDAYMICLLAYYGWNKLSEDIADAEQMDAGIRD